MAEEVKDNTIDKLSESQKEELKRQFNDQLQKLGEVFSQCWESEEFKQAFISDPKAIFKEYEINYTASSFDELYEIICEWASVS